MQILLLREFFLLVAGIVRLVPVESVFAVLAGRGVRAAAALAIGRLPVGRRFLGRRGRSFSATVGRLVTAGLGLAPTPTLVVVLLRVRNVVVA